jgi:thiamine-monophosphate kinase
MDVSDGLSTDLSRLCVASGVGATVESIPVDAQTRAVAELLGDEPELYALDGGEDFALIAVVAASAFGYLAARFAQRFGTPLIRVGTIGASAGLRRSGGATIVAAGWDHLSGS